MWVYALNFYLLNVLIYIHVINSSSFPSSYVMCTTCLCLNIVLLGYFNKGLGNHSFQLVCKTKTSL